MTSILDASALLALLNDEPGATRVAEAVKSGAMIGAVNLGEVVAKLSDHGVRDAEIAELLGGLGLAVPPFDEAAAYATGNLRRTTPQRGLSFGDRACLTLALKEHVPVLTADRDWDGLVPGVRLEWIR